MAATYVVITNATTSNLSAAGDHGRPSVYIPKHAPGVASTENVEISDLLGNVLLCTTLGTWITDGHITITRGGHALTAADLTAWAEGADMNRSDYDANDDGVVDAATMVLETNRTAVTFALSPFTATVAMDTLECNTTGGAITINLPTAVGNTGKSFKIMDTTGLAGTSAITVDGSGSQTINGALTATISAAYGWLEIYSNGANWIAKSSPVNPYQYKGTIAAANQFPLIAAVKIGWAYLITTAVVDNGGATYTNTSGVYAVGETIVWNGSGWNVQSAQNTFSSRGNIAVATDFPLVATVKNGHVYRCTAGVTDNGGATYTNTGQVFLLGDMIVWLTNAWYVVSRGAATATPAAIGSAAAGTSLVASNQDHVHAHGNQLGGTLHSDVVAGSTAGFMTGTQATTLIRVNDHTMALKLPGVTMTVDESEVSAQLTGDVGKKFSPTHVVVTVISVTGTPATPATLNIGTSTGGTQISSALAMTGLILAGDTRMIPLSAGTFNIAGNATLYANVEANEAVATSLVCDVWVHGILTTPT